MNFPWHLNLADEAMMRDIRNQEGEDTIGSLIYEMNQKVGPLGSSGHGIWCSVGLET